MADLFKNWKSRSKEIVENDNQTWLRILRNDVIKELDEILNSGLIHSDLLNVGRTLIEDLMFFYLYTEINQNKRKYIRFTTGKQTSYSKKNLIKFETYLNKKDYDQLKFQYFILAKVLIGSVNKSEYVKQLAKFDKRRRIPLYKKALEIYNEENIKTYGRALEIALEAFPYLQMEIEQIDEKKKEPGKGLQNFKNSFKAFRSRKHTRKKRKVKL